MFISLVQRAPTHMRVIHCIEDDHRTLDSYVQELDEMGLTWGWDFLPHDGKVADFKTGKTTIQLLRKLGRNVYPQPLPQLGIENGIKLARMLFPRIYIDVEYGARLVECLKRYRRGVNATTNEEGSPVHDEYSHGADNFRYIAVAESMMANEYLGETAPRTKPYRPRDRVLGV